MPSFIAGFIIFALLFLAKNRLAFVLIHKKQVALSLFIIVLSELLMIFILHVSINKYRLDSLKLLIGFMIGVTLVTAYYSYKFLARSSEREENEL